MYQKFRKGSFVMLEGTRTLNPQIRSLMRYPLRHEHSFAIFEGGRTISFLQMHENNCKKLFLERLELLIF